MGFGEMLAKGFNRHPTPASQPAKNSGDKLVPQACDGVAVSARARVLAVEAMKRSDSSQSGEAASVIPAPHGAMRTTSKLLPVTCLSVPRAVSSQRASGAPERYQLLPLSATNMP